MTTNNLPRVGILGAGFMGKAHAECYQRLGVPIAAIYSRNPKRVVVKDPQTTVASDYISLINDPDVDCVDITLPNHLHEETAMACIAANKPFLIEKPLARNVDEGGRIVAAARAKGLVAVYGENVRFKPAAVKIKSIIDQGGLGKVLLMRATEVHNGPAHSDWFWDRELTGGGAVIDMGIHGIAALEWLAGSRIKRVYAELDTLKWHDRCLNGAEDSGIVVLRFESGAIGELVVSWAASGGIDVRMELLGSQGSAFLDSSRSARGITIHSDQGYGAPIEEEAAVRPHVSATAGWSWPVGDEWSEHGHLAEIQHFIKCVQGTESPVSTLEDGYRALQVVDAIYRSAVSGNAEVVRE